MNTVTFDITKSKTVVTVVGETSVQKIDITDTPIEKEFVKVLKLIMQHRGNTTVNKQQ